MRFTDRISLVRRSGVAALGVLIAAASAVAVGADPADAAGTIAIDVVSSQADQVSGGDAKIHVSVSGIPLDQVVVRRNGVIVTSLFAKDVGAGKLVGVVDGLLIGSNSISATGGGVTASKALKNHPITGPIFSGAQQYPFLCRTEQSGLGKPLVDNQNGKGFKIKNASGTVIGWSKDCSANKVIDRLYRSTNGTFKPMPTTGRPADMSTTTTSHGKTVDYVILRERGTINRFMYAYAGLEGENWNGRLVYRFAGGVGIGHDQGKLLEGQYLDHRALSLGYAVIFSTGTRMETHYNLQLAAETALMVKEHFIEAYGQPLYTVGLGESGGSIQQYHNGSRYGSRIIDAAIPQYSYPDMATQMIHVIDCELLEYYMDVTDKNNTKWQNWDNRTALIGFNGSSTVKNAYRGNTAGSDECVNGWRGLTPLTMNPKYFKKDSLWSEMAPAGVADTVQWTHWADLGKIYGYATDGYARSAWDNTGVQYGLSALTSGKITADEFLALNAKVGSWKAAKDMVQEGCPYVGTCTDWTLGDPWSSRNMRLSGDGGVTPAPRTAGDRTAIAAAYNSGMAFNGKIDIPIIDWRPYLEEQLDMHNAHQSFATRQRMLDYDGHAENQAIWMTVPGYDHTVDALKVIDEWMTNIRNHPSLGVVGNKPTGAADACFDGTKIYQGDNVWDGILNSQAAGACTSKFPLYGTSRTVAGGPLKGGIFACTLQTVDSAIAKGLYGGTPSAAQTTRLKQIFPNGVCDYSQPDAGKP